MCVATLYLFLQFSNTQQVALTVLACFIIISGICRCVLIILSLAQFMFVFVSRRSHAGQQEGEEPLV